MIVIGKYQELYGENYSPLKEMIGNVAIDKKASVLGYLKNAPVIAVAAAKMVDVISGEAISGELSTQSDGMYAWRSDVSYYFEKYNLKLPDDFIKHVLDQQDVND